MAVITELRKSIASYPPVLAVVGATDLAVEQVRKAAADPAALQAEVTSRLTKAAAEVGDRLTKAATEVEKAVSSMDAKTLRDGARQAPALVVARALEVAGQLETGYELLADRGKTLVHRVENQKATQELVSQGKATLSRTRSAVTTARKEAVQAERVERSTARKAVKRTAASAKGAATSARRTAAKAVQAAEATAEKVGD